MPHEEGWMLWVREKEERNNKETACTDHTSTLWTGECDEAKPLYMKWNKTNIHWGIQGRERRKPSCVSWKLAIGWSGAWSCGVSDRAG